MSGLTQVRNALFNLRQLEAPLPSRDEMIRALEGIEGAILASARTSTLRSRGLHDALLALHRVGGGATPMQIGMALDPSKDGYVAGSLGSVRLTALKHAGLVHHAHFGWWELTDLGREEIEKLHSEARA